MGRKIALSGYFSGEQHKPAPVNLVASISGSGMSEMLALECAGKYGVTIPYRPIERLAREAYAQFATQQKTAVEPSIRLPAQGANREKGEVTVYLRMSGSFMMLTLEYMQLGQISAPFAPIEKMVRAERSMFA